MSFRWDSFLNKVIPAVEGVIGKELVYNKFNDALAKMVSGYEKIANENAGIINPALAVKGNTDPMNEKVVIPTFPGRNGQTTDGTLPYNPNDPSKVETLPYNPNEQTGNPKDAYLQNPNMREMPIGRQGSTDNNPYAEVGKRPESKTDLLKFYSMAQEEIAKLKDNPYDKGVYSGKLTDMYTKLTTKEKQEKIFNTEIDKDGNLWRVDTVTGAIELIKEGTPKKKDDVRKGLSFYSSETVDGVEKYFYTEYDNEGNAVKNEIPYELYKSNFEDKQKIPKGNSPKGYSPKGPGNKDDKDKDKKRYDAEGSTPTNESWTWTSKKSGKQYTLGPVALPLIPKNIEAYFDRARNEGKVDEIYNHYMNQYKAMGLDKQTMQEITDWFNELYDLYYPITDKQGKAK